MYIYLFRSDNHDQHKACKIWGEKIRGPESKTSTRNSIEIDRREKRKERDADPAKPKPFDTRANGE
jgi:hypothetical protein